ncbi:anthranilate phosphoribosyltransferase [Serratia ureilytica]|uniref:anthranilate phosphoribosyltransferase n=1 Tax=Serratia ureilytica TaxID=300181 RepID=UPI00254CB61C|nr:anthranilate phosphoribosyltransferase [Serratia ureilytica]MDK7594114.1 anthranilate phosphoribosyltransferase [Serratia ureilytica]
MNATLSIKPLEERFRNVLQILVEKRLSLSREQTRDLVQAMLGQQLDDMQIGALLVAMAQKGESADEIAGAVDAIAARCRPLVSGLPLTLNIGGTGGDRSGTFNISTTAALVVAAAGVPVIKHGNSRVTSVSGSSDMMSALGIDVSRKGDEAWLRRSLATSNFAFLSTSSWYAFPERLTAVRRALGVRSLFNLSGSLVHPANVTHQLIGVAHASLLYPMAEALVRLGKVTAFIVHGAGDLDEVSCLGETQVLCVSDGCIGRFSVQPDDFEVPACELRALRGGAAERNAKICLAVLNGERGAYRNATIVSAATALVLAGKTRSFGEAAKLVRQVLDNGRAYQVLKRFKETMNENESESLRHHAP